MQPVIRHLRTPKGDRAPGARIPSKNKDGHFLPQQSQIVYVAQDNFRADSITDGHFGLD
jgi:hypothetical protein